MRKIKAAGVAILTAIATLAACKTAAGGDVRELEQIATADWEQIDTERDGNTRAASGRDNAASIRTEHRGSRGLHKRGGAYRDHGRGRRIV